MSLITLVAAKGDLRDPAPLLRAAGIAPSAATPDWLAPGRACDVALARLPDSGEIGALREILAPYRIDLFLCPDPARRRKRLLLADMDSTIVTSETLDELAGFVGLREETVEVTKRSMNGEIDFTTSLIDRVALLRGLSESALHDTRAATRLTPGAATLIKTSRAHGVTCILVSGGFTFFTQAVAARCGFNHHHGNTLDIQDGTLTGRVIPPILDRTAKLDFLNTYRTQFRLDAIDTLAVGDGANDLSMLEAAGLGIGFRPKPILAERLSNLALYNDLTALLFAQGYRADEFAIDTDGDGL